jgi:forespore regulator of the sigma-K checkpoint
MKKRWLTLGAYLLLAGAVAGLVWLEREPAELTAAEAAAVLSFAVEEEPGDASAATAAALQTIRKGKNEREVYIHKKYVCGEETEQAGAMRAEEILSLYGEHPDARLMLDEAGRVHIVEQIDDLAPKYRENAYMGLDKNGNLSMFDGIPEQDRVIRTFFQLDVQHMKSSLPNDAVNQLYSGIRIADMADYNSVLSTFSEYASQQAAPAANPNP